MIEPFGRVVTLHAAWADFGEVPRGDAWLTRSEAVVQGGLRFAKRREDWRVGRWTAKAAVSACLGGVPVEDIEVLATEDGSPSARIPGSDAGRVAISLSHSQGRGFAVAAQGAMSLGCDLEALAPRSLAFIRDYFTESERAAVMALQGSPRDEGATLVWAAKEAALKAMRQGLRADTRSVEVRFGEQASVGVGWAQLAVSRAAGTPLRGWLRVFDEFAWAVVTDASGTTRILERRGRASAAD